MTKSTIRLLHHNSVIPELPMGSLITFPGGEPYSDLDAAPTFCLPNKEDPIVIDARIADSEGFVRLLNVIDALKTLTKKIELFIPYFPGARQDRRMGSKSFSLKIYANIINSFNLDKVTVLEPHSDVAAALINNIHLLNISDISYTPSLTYDGVICPDAGAFKRVSQFAYYWSIDKVYYGTKHRDTRTGLLSQFSCEKLPPGKYLVVDDICDGGGTFIGLAEAIKKQSKKVELDLFVFHSIFSKGLTQLLKHYNTIFTTDSFPHGQKHKRLKVIKLEVQ